MGINQYIKIGSKIKKARISKGIRQKDMAEKLGLSISTYSNYENNYREPKLDIVEKICEILDMTIDELMNFPISNDESCSADSLSYENSYSYASSEEELQENSQIEFTRKKDNNIHKYDGSIRVNHSLPPEAIENLQEINAIHKKIENNEKLSENDLQILKDYNLRQELTMKRLKASLQTMQKALMPLLGLQSAYDMLNELGKKEAAKRIEELTEIERYTKPEEWSKDKPTKEKIDEAVKTYLREDTPPEPPQE